MIVTTLPLCYRRNRSFKMFFTPFVAKCINNLLGGKLVLPLNLMGIRDIIPRSEYNAVVESYRKDLELLGIKIPAAQIFHDMDQGFLDFVFSEVIPHESSGRFRRESRPITFCSCGRIELPNEVFISIQKQERMKLMIQRNGTDIMCKACESSLQTRDTEVLIHDYTESTLGCQLVPHTYSNRARGIIKEIVDHPVIFSRHYRPEAGSLVLEPGTMIDPDYCWGHYLGYLKKCFGDSEFVVVAGVNHLVQAYRMIILTRDLDPSIRVSLVVHPLITIRNGDENLNKMTLEEYLDRCGSSTSAQLFFSLGLQWNRFDSIIPFSELALVQQSLIGKDLSSITPPMVRPCELKDMATTLKRDNVLRILKRIRRRSPLLIDEQTLFSSVCS